MTAGMNYRCNPGLLIGSVTFDPSKGSFGNVLVTHPPWPRSCLMAGDDTGQNIRTSEAGGSRAGILRRGVLHHGCAGSTRAEYAGAATQYARNAEGTASSSDYARTAQRTRAGYSRSRSAGSAEHAAGVARASAEYQRPWGNSWCPERARADRARTTSGARNARDKSAESAAGG